MNEELISRNRESVEEMTTENIKGINTKMILLILIATGYSILFITMTMNTIEMKNNLNTIVNNMDNVLSKQVNITTIEKMQNDLTLLKDCMLNKYCKRVPD
jgi:hypothetical protein